MKIITRLAALAACLLLLLAPGVRAQKSSGDGGGRPTDRKPQSAVAAKNVAFAAVVADAAAVKAALKADDLAGAKKQIGKTATFTGTVAKVFEPRGNSLVLINFAKNYRDAVTVVVRAKDFAKFPVLSVLKGKRVVVTGKVSDYKGQPQVEIAEPAALRLVK